MKNNKKKQIMLAAEKLFFTRRFHEITTDAIAKEASVGKGTIYRYFEDKDDLFYQTAMSGFEELCILLEQHNTVDLQAPLEEKLLKTCAQIGGFFESRHRLFRLIQAQENHLSLSHSRLKKDLHERRQRLTKLVADILSAHLQPEDLRIEMPMTELAGLFVGLIRSRVFNYDHEQAENASYKQVVDLFLYGCRQPESQTKVVTE